MVETDVTIESVREVGVGTVALELRTPEGFDALPGQFVKLTARPDDEEVTRYYTLSSPYVEETFELTVGVDPDGDLSPWLAARDPGETVRIEGPHGRVTYDGEGDVVTVAGGPGIGPAVAIAEAAREAGHGAVVVYQDDHPAHEDRLASLEEENVPVSVVDEGDDERLTAVIADHLDDGQFYVFGFADFVEFVADAIDDAGGDADDALIENFG